MTENELFIVKLRQLQDQNLAGALELFRKDTDASLAWAIGLMTEIENTIPDEPSSPREQNGNVIALLTSIGLAEVISRMYPEPTN